MPEKPQKPQNIEVEDIASLEDLNQYLINDLIESGFFNSDFVFDSDFSFSFN